MAADDASQQACDSCDSPFEPLGKLLPMVVLSNQVMLQRIEATTLLTESIRRSSDDIARRLARSRGRHVLLTGRRGVGKTTLIWRMAQLARKGSYEFLAKSTFVWLDCSNVGPEDSRACLEALFGITNKSPDQVVLCIDGLASLLRRPNGGTNKPLLKALLSQTNLRFIGVMSEWEFAEQIGSDYGMQDHFARVEVAEPSSLECQRIVEFHAQLLTDVFKLEMDQDVIHRCLTLSSTFLLGGSEPLNSVSLLQQSFEDLRFERQELHRDVGAVVTTDHIIASISERTGIPVSTIAGTGDQIDFQSALGHVVVGQHDAVSDVANELRLIKAGLNEPGKPATVLLFAGMTGVGKTELAKRVAELYSSSKRLNTYSMGNYTEPHSVSSIVGVPPGYVGHEEGGRLINELNSDPYSVFLLDEAEKCHPNIWKPFLNLFDEGWIADQRGVRAFADRAIFILTTNAGDRNIAQMWGTAKTSDEMREAVKQALAKVRHERASQPVFPPQFLARIRRIVLFGPLDESAMKNIAALKLAQMQERWNAKRQIWLEFDDGLVDCIGRHGNRLNQNAKGTEGGRIIARIISDRVEQKIQERILTGGLSGRRFKIRVDQQIDAALPFELQLEPN